MQLIDKLTFECPKTGYKAEIEFHGKVGNGGKKSDWLAYDGWRAESSDGCDLPQWSGDSPFEWQVGRVFLPQRCKEEECKNAE